MDDALGLETLAYLLRVLRFDANHAPATRGLRGRQRGSPIRLRPVNDFLGERGHMRADPVQPKVEEQFETGVHAGEILKWQRDELETPGVVAPRHVVVAQSPEIVGA